ncbi:MAG: ATP-grasp domain-containing protein [Janthinobacterium lividum]
MKTVYIQSPATSGEPMHEHCLAAWQGFKWLGYKVVFSEEWLPEQISPDTPFVGTVEGVQDFFKWRARVTPAPLNVPDALLPFAGRAIERSTLGKFLDSAPLPAFLKPADTHKLFTGGVISSRVNGRLIMNDYPADTPVLVSPEIEIASEYRVFVDREKGMVGMKHYLGEPFMVPDYDAIKQMIAAYKPFAPRCYSLDVGVIEENNSNRQHTIVVECNDFWALGTYGFDPVKYAELLALRWHELVREAKPCPVPETFYEAM